MPWTSLGSALTAADRPTGWDGGIRDGTKAELARVGVNEDVTGPPLGRVALPRSDPR